MKENINTGNIEAESLDEIVHDLKVREAITETADLGIDEALDLAGHEAAVISNAGLSAQIAYLLTCMSKEALQEIINEIGKS